MGFVVFIAVVVIVAVLAMTGGDVGKPTYGRSRGYHDGGPVDGGGGGGGGCDGGGGGGG